jgi:hypothetical protein
MEAIEDFLHFLAVVHGKTPDKLKTLERQAIAVLAAAAFNRFAPAVPQGVLINTLTRGVGRYIARHPLATLAAFWFAAYRNSQFRPQWAGEYTREIETAAFTPLFAKTPVLLRYAGRGLSLVLRPGLAQNTSRLTRMLSKLRVPPVPESFVNNPATRGAIRYVSRHPAAALAAYFTSQYIDSTYRPQFLGPYSQELIAGGLLPVFAHGTRTLPTLIRGAGATVNYGARATAYSLDTVLGWFAAKNKIAAAGFLTPGGQVVPAEGLIHIRPYPLPSGTIDGFVTVSGKFLTRAEAMLSVENRALFVLARTWDHLGAAFNLPKALSIGNPLRFFPWLGRGFIDAATRLVDVKYFWAFPRTSRAIISASWAATGILKGILPLELIYGEQAWFRYVTRSLAGVAGSGFVAPFLITGTLRGAGQELAIWGRNIYGAIRHPVRFVTHEAQAAANFLRLRQAATLVGRARELLPFLRQIPGAGLRALGSWPVAFGLVAREGLLTYAEGTELRPEDWQTMQRLRLTSFEQLRRENAALDRATFYHQLIIARREVGLTISRLSEALGSGTSLPDEDVRGYVLETNIAIQNINARRERDTQTAFRYLETAANAFLLLPTLAAPAVETSINWFDNTLGVQPGPSSAQRDRWRTQPRDARGRFVRQQFELNTAEPGPAFGFDQALAYINRMAAAAQLTAQQSASVGIPVQPVFSAGGGGQSSAGRPREFWLHRGRDRNLILQTLRDLLEILNRDELAASGVKTTTISTKEPIFGESFPGLPAAVIIVIRALEYHVGLVRNRGPEGGYHSLSDKELTDYLYSMWPNLSPFGADLVA